MEEGHNHPSTDEETSGLTATIGAMNVTAAGSVPHAGLGPPEDLEVVEMEPGPARAASSAATLLAGDLTDTLDPYEMFLDALHKLNTLGRGPKTQEYVNRTYVEAVNAFEALPTEELKKKYENSIPTQPPRCANDETTGSDGATTYRPKHHGRPYKDHDRRYRFDR